MSLSTIQSMVSQLLSRLGSVPDRLSQLLSYVSQSLSRISNLSSMSSQMMGNISEILQTIQQLPDNIKNEIINTFSDMGASISDFFGSLELPDLKQYNNLVNNANIYVDDWFDQMNDAVVEVVNHPSKRWYPDINFDETSNGGIHYYETIKIRMLLQKIHEPEGFPIRFCRDLNFTQFLGISIPTGFTVHKLQTINLWKNDKSSRWRQVYITWNGLELDNYLYSILGFVPIYGPALVTMIRATVYESAIRLYPIYENLAYRSALNDNIILANWDKVVKELNQYGR
jgi:hypothetical protein